jgi:hypothetical protein
MIQYAFPLMLEDGKVCVSSQDDAYRAGNPFLRRGQATLDSEVESPTLVAAQCRLLAAIYSANQGNYNTAHAMVEIAEQILSVIDVEDGSEVDRELFWRLRTCSRSQDVRFSLKLGRIRPNTHPKSKELLDYVTEKEATAGFSWLTFHRQLFLLSETVEDMARAFMSKCDEALFEDGQGDGSGGSDGGSRFYEDAEARESCAVFMRQQLSRLRTWLEQVPDAMKTARIAADESFSTAQSPLKLAEGDPMWLQRLRLDLECQYHDFCLTLLRPFVCFSPTPTRGTFASDNNCMSCASHAIALTGMLAQVMHETDILTGCPQAFEWLQNAVYALAGFATGYPISTRSPTARTALATADQVFVRLRSVAPGAPRMRDVAAELEAKAREIVQSFREGVVDLNGGGGAAAAASTTKETPPTTTAASSSIPSRSRGAQTASAKDNNDRPAPDPVTAPNPTPAPASAAPEQTLAGSGDAAHDLPFFADPDLVSGIGAVWDTDMELGLEWWPSQGTGGPDLWSTWMQDYDATAITG